MNASSRSERRRPAEILLVEDNPGDVELTREALAESGMDNNLHVVTDGDMALEYLRASGKGGARAVPDLILLDLNLPRRDGREVLAVIKADDRLKTIPVVVLTTSKDDSDVSETYQGHANCYIQKPLEFSRFITVVQAIENYWFKIAMLPPKE